MAMAMEILSAKTLHFYCSRRSSSMSALRISVLSSRYSLSSSSKPPVSPPPRPTYNPPDPENPDPATLREQWKYAIGLYSKWYSHAWGTAILAGVSFFALGWFVKGENPLLGSKDKEEGAVKEPD